MTKIRYRVFALNFTAALINYGDRVALSAAAPFVLDEFGFSPALWGIILSAFFWTYSPFALIGGFLVDRVGVRRAYMVCMLTWSLTVPLTAAAWNAVSMIGARLLFGAGEGPQAAISTKLTSNWFPRRQTSTMLNLAQSGTTIGPIVATPLVVWACTALGWRPTFVILAAFGVVWCALWWWIGRDRPADHPGVNSAEYEYITADHAAPTPTASGSERPGFWSLLRSPRIAALAIAFFAYSWVLFMFMTWYPTYLVDTRDVTKSQLGAVATVPWIAATAGLILGGLVADHLVRRSGNQVTPRKWMIVGSLVAVAVCFGPSPFVTSPVGALALVCVAMFFLLASYHYQALIVSLIPDTHTGRLAGLIQMCSTLAGILAPIVTGAVVEATGSYTPAFLVGAGLAIVGAVAVAGLRHGGTPVAVGAVQATAPVQAE